MTNHEFARACASIIRTALHHNDGTRPCVAGVLSPQWINGRANNAAVAIADLFEQEGRALIALLETRGNVVVGEIGAIPQGNPGDDEARELAEKYIK